MAKARRPKTDSYPVLFQKIWQACRQIPEGKVASYGYLARAIRNPGAARAVAMAMARNPFAPEVPCHRVVRSDGTLGGYSAPGGLAAKVKYLKKEGVRFSLGNRIHPDCLLV